MATTTFCDIKMTENAQGYTYENKEYNWEKGDIVSLPYHTASRFVNKWGQAEWAKEPYEVRDEDYEHVLGAQVEKEVCEAEKSDGEVCGREKPCSYHDEE